MRNFFKATIVTVLALLAGCGERPELTEHRTAYYFIDANNNQTEVTALEVCNEVDQLNETGEDLLVKEAELYREQVQSSTRYRFLPDEQMTSDDSVPYDATDLTLELEICTIEVEDSRRIRVIFH